MYRSFQSYYKKQNHSSMSKKRREQCFLPWYHPTIPVPQFQTNKKPFQTPHNLSQQKNTSTKTGSSSPSCLCLLLGHGVGNHIASPWPRAGVAIPSPSARAPKVLSDGPHQDVDGSWDPPGRSAQLPLGRGCGPIADPVLVETNMSSEQGMEERGSQLTR